MMRQRCLLALPLLAFAGPVLAQSVPEGIHSMGNGDGNVCGFTATTIAGLEEQTKRRPDTQSLAGSVDYRAYATGGKILTFTTERSKAHPAVACRSPVRDPDGGISLRTEISCANTRANCDWLYREFEALDQRVMRDLKARN